MSWISQDTKIYLKGMWKDLWYYSSLSFSIALSIILGTGIGYLLDKHYLTTPTWTLVGIFIGTCAGFRNIYLAMKRAQNFEEED